MATRFSKRMIILAAVALLGGGGAYAAGLTGIDPGQLIVESRCSAGAFMKHAQAPATLEADARTATVETASNVAEHDPASAIVQPAPAVTGASNLIPNPALETIAGGQPSAWTTARYGHNNATFSQVAGHSSTRAVRVDITAYTDGNASWTEPVLPVTPGGYYEFSDYYRSNVVTPVSLMLQTSQGQRTFIAVGSAPQNVGWTRYATRFFVPAGVTQMQIVHALDRLGSLETDDYNLTQVTPTGFDQGRVTLTFDDGWLSVHDTALPIMSRYHLVSTQYLVSGFLGTKGYDRPGQIYDFIRAGHEVGSHTFDHRDLTRLPEAELSPELTLPRQGLSRCFGPVTTFAAPYGAYNLRTTEQVKKLYATARSTDAGFNSADDLNPYELKVQNLRSDTSPEQVQAWLDTAKQNHLWLILVYHQIDTSHDEYARTPANFESDLQKIVATGLPVQTMHDAYQAIQPQLKH